jgi:hypothetical protein
MKNQIARLVYPIILTLAIAAYFLNPPTKTLFSPSSPPEAVKALVYFGVLLGIAAAYIFNDKNGLFLV